MFSGNTETLITATYKDSDGTVDLVVNNDLANYSNASSGFLTSQTSHADVVQDGDFTSQGIMLRGAGAGSYSILTDASANWNTAYTHSQAAHAPAGAITDITNEEFTALSDVDATVAGDDGKILYYDHASTSFKWKTDTGGTPAGYNNTNWDTAFGWGDHASGGYLTSIAVNSINDTHIDWGTGANQVSTADIPEATNLYYTDARADARITNAGSANWNTAYTHSQAAHAPAGAITDITNEEFTALSDVDATVAGDDGKILYYDHASTSFKWKTDATGGGGGDIFKTLAVAGQSDVVADSATDTLTLVAGSNMTITTNATTDTITFAAAGGGGGGSSSYTFTVNYAVGGTSIQSITNLPAGWSSSINGSNVTITHTASGQPMGISFYGLDKSASPDTWKYGYPTSTYPVTFPDTGAGEVISTTEFTLNVGTSATGANTGTPFATSLAHIKVVF